MAYRLIIWLCLWLYGHMAILKELFLSLLEVYLLYIVVNYFYVNFITNFVYKIFINNTSSLLVLDTL